MTNWTAGRLSYFNSRPHEEVDLTGKFGNLMCDSFQLTTSRRGRLIPSESPYLLPIFQLTTSRRGRRAIASQYLGSGTFQLTTSRRGRLPGVLPLFLERYFNSRPHEEVDRAVYRNEIRKEHFNSRPHEEVDYD